MGTVDLDYLKQGFASLVQQAEQTTLPPFILWLDLKVAEFKVNGFMMLDDSRASSTSSGENWIEFIHRWRNHHNFGGYQGYPYFYPPIAANQHQPNQLPGSHVAENTPHNRRPEPPSGDHNNPLRHRIPEPVDTGQPADPPHNVVQIKPEPDFERLQQDIRPDRHPHTLYNEPPLQRRPSFEYPVVPENIRQQLQETTRREQIPLPIDYQSHIDRGMLRHNHDGHGHGHGPIHGPGHGHEHIPPDFLPNTDNRNKDTLPERPRSLHGLSIDTRDSEPTNVTGFIKMTQNSSGGTLVSRQTANRCPVCNRIFHYYSSFNRHMKLHQGVFTHICEVCRRKFTRKEHFVRHKCHRRPNKPSRMADQSDTSSLGGSIDPLVQPPPTANEIPSPREVSIPPPLIHISQMADTIAASSSSLSLERNAFTYDHQQPVYANSAMPPSLTSTTTPMEISLSSTNSMERFSEKELERPPYFVEASTNNNSKHRRKTTTPMKVENFMEPLPSIDTPTETPTRRSPVDIPEVFEKHHMDYSGERPMTYNYRRASSSDLGKSSSSAGEFNISRPQSRNSEPARSSHFSSSFDHPSLDALAAGATQQDLDEKQQQSGSGKSTPTPTSGGGGGLRDDQYPVLKKKVLEAACHLAQHVETRHNNHTTEEGEEDSLGISDRGFHGEDSRGGHPEHGSGGSEDHMMSDDYRGYVDEGTELHSGNMSASGTPTGQSSPSGHDTASTTTPTGAAPTTPTSVATPSSVTALSPFDSQSGDGPPADLPYEQHISPTGSTRENSLSLNTSLNLSSAYAISEPSSPTARQQQQQQGDIHCQSCNKKFLHLSSLNRHMKLHQGVFSHACAVCSRKFTRKEHFVNHKCSRRPRNPTRLMDAVEPDSLQSLPQKVEFPPSMAVPRQPSPPPGAAWNTGGLGGMGIGTGPPQPGPSLGGDGGSPTLSPSSPEQRRLLKWKSKWK